MLKKILLVLLAVLVIIQFIRPAKNISTAAPTGDISTVYPVPDSVHKILVKACYDCHSNNTVYPWYSTIQPVYWWMNNHITEGKKHLNFDEFAAQTPQKKAKWIRHIYEQVDSNEMPLDSYTWIHKDAILSKEEKDLVINWAQAIYAQMPDSLKKKKQK
jgi:hypothetical protein